MEKIKKTITSHKSHSGTNDHLATKGNGSYEGVGFGFLAAVVLQITRLFINVFHFQTGWPYFLPDHFKSLPQLVALFIYQSEYMRPWLRVQAYLMDV